MQLAFSIDNSPSEAKEVSTVGDRRLRPAASQRLPLQTELGLESGEERLDARPKESFKSAE